MTELVDLATLNNSIKKQYDKYFASLLTDVSLQRMYMKTSCFKKTKSEIHSILERHLCKDACSAKILERIVYTINMRFMSPSMKSSVRGSKVNTYIEKKLTKLFSSCKNGTVVFEAKHEKLHERADWIITKGAKTYIGFNQIDLWNGGAQLNRASKYILDDTLHKRLAKDNIYIICLVVRKITLKNKNKIYNIIHHGLQKKRLFWLKGFEEYLKTL